MNGNYRKNFPLGSGLRPVTLHLHLGHMAETDGFVYPDASKYDQPLKQNET